MRAFVRLIHPDGTRSELGHGDLIGRLRSAALCINDPRVSEAHAVVSLRRGELVLLALRRMVAVRGRAVSDVVLRSGMTIELVEGLTLTVDEVRRPASVLAIEMPGLGRRTLDGTVSLLVQNDTPHLVARFEPGAAMHVWSDGDTWHARTERETVQVGPGSVVHVAGHAASFVIVELADATTTPGAGGLEPGLRLIAWYDTVEIHREARPPFTLVGVGARIMSELVAVGGPVDWQIVAREIWREPDIGMHDLRHRWDVALARLRTKLKEAGVRTDLLRSSGVGQVQLLKYQADVFENNT